MQHRDWLMGQAVTLCRNRADAEDLVQETLLRFIKAFEHSEAFPDRRTCASWLITALTNLFYDQCRKKQVQKQNARDPALNVRTQVDPERAVIPDFDTVTSEQFAQAVDTLSPPMRTTLELYAQGKKYRDIASTLGIQVGTVSKRLHDIREKMGALLRPHRKVN